MSKPTKSKSKKSNSRKAHRHLGKPAKGRKPPRTNSRKRGPLPADASLAGVSPSEIKPTQVRAPIADCDRWDTVAHTVGVMLGLLKPMGRAVWLRWLANIAVTVDPQVFIDLIPAAPTPELVAALAADAEKRAADRAAVIASPMAPVVEPEPAGNVAPTSTPVDAQLVEEPTPTVASVLATQEVKPADAPLQTTTDEAKLAPRDPEADADEPRVEYTP